MNRARLFSVLSICVVAFLTFVPVFPVLAASPEVIHFRDSGEDFHVFDCGTFFVNGASEEKGEITTYFNQAGVPIKLKVHMVFNGQLTNETTGKALRDWDRYTVSVDLQSSSITYAGLPARFFIPGAGVIIRDAGKIVFDPATNAVQFQAGPHPFFYITDQEFVTLICSALA